MISVNEEERNFLSTHRVGPGGLLKGSMETAD